MQITVDQLRAITAKLMLHLEASGHSSVEVHHDFYWHIPEDQVYDLSHPPTDHTVGQLFDDWNELKKLLETNRDPIAYDFVWLASLLRVIGEQLVS